MRTKQITVAVIQDDRRAKRDKDGNEVYPIKLRITYGGERLYYPLIEGDCSKALWEEVVKPKGGGKRIQDLRNLKSEKEAQANAVVKRIEKEGKTFTLARFNQHYKTTPDDKTKSASTLSDDIFKLIESYSIDLKAEGRISTGESYESLLGSLLRFTNKKQLAAVSLTPKFLQEYHNFMKIKGRKDGKGGQRDAGIGIYMRNLRHITKMAVKANFLSEDEYPFGKNEDGKYQIPIGGNTKKALTIEETRAIRDFPLQEGSTAKRGRDLWYFSYLCNGMNLKDVCQLKWENVDMKRHTLEFIRAKTIRTNRRSDEDKTIRVTMPRTAIEILERWANPDNRSTAYVFPFLRDGMKPQQIRYATLAIVKSVNKSMKQIAVELNIPASVTSYHARHSYATISIRTGTQPLDVANRMGHTTLQLVSRYVKEVEEEEQRRQTEALE